MRKFCRITQRFAIVTPVAHPEDARFARLNASLFEQLFNGCAAEFHRAGHLLFLQGDAGDRIYGVLSGTLEVSFYSASGRKLVANLETRHSLTGEIGALDGGPRSASVSCLTDCTLVSLSRGQLMERLIANPEICKAVIELLCRRLRWISGEFGDQAMLPIEQRLAKRLLFLRDMMADNDGWIRISQSDIAEFLGATRESVNKALKDWRVRNLIDIKRGRILVRDHGQLHVLTLQDS